LDRPEERIVRLDIGTPVSSRFFDQMDANGDVNVALVGAVTVEADVLRARLDERNVAGGVGGSPDDFALVTVGIDEKDRPGQQARCLFDALRVGGLARG
jgi:hypothetical protein